MNATPYRSGSWTARLAWMVLLLLAGAALAVWGLSRWDAGARFLGVTPRQPQAIVRQAAPAPPVAAIAAPQAGIDSGRIAALESRLAGIESATQAAAGSVGRADALLIAFAARRAIDRGVALGYLEPLLVQRFGAVNQRAVATVITASRDPVRLDALVAELEGLGPALRGGTSGRNIIEIARRRAGRRMVGRPAPRIWHHRQRPSRGHAVAPAPGALRSRAGEGEGGRGR